MTNTFDAQFGSASGGVVNLVLQARNEHVSRVGLRPAQEPRDGCRQLDSTTTKTPSSGPARRPRAMDTQNDFGASVGGPVRVPWLYNGKDKTFFFFNYEGFRQINGGTSAAMWAPTQAMLGGDFSCPSGPGDRRRRGHAGPYSLYDYTTCTGANQGQTLPGLREWQQDHRSSGPGLCRRIQGDALPPLRRHQPLRQHSMSTSSNHEQADMWNIRVDENINARNKISASYFTGNMPYVSTSTASGPLFDRRRHAGQQISASGL
jgi:hypothetical protein